MNNLVAQNQSLMAPPEGAWGAEDTSTKDLLIPELKLLHKTSKLVEQDKGKAGQIIDSTTNQLLAEKGASVEVIPIKTFVEWEVQELGDNSQWKTTRRERITPANEDAMEEFEEFGSKMRRIRCLNFFMVLPSQSDKLPFLLRLKKGSIYAGKKLSTHFQTSQMKNLPPARTVFALSSNLTTYRDFSYYVFAVEAVREASEAEKALAYKWWQQLNQAASVKVADEMEEPSFGN